MKHKLRLLTGLTLLVLVLLPLGTVWAIGIPCTPQLFTGSVTVGGSPADDGTIITAWAGATLITSTATSGGIYALEFCPDDGAGHDYRGDTIVFKVDGVVGGQHVCPNNPGAPITVNLVVEVVTEPDIWVNPTFENFGTVTVGSSEMQTFTVGNDGNAVLEVSTITISGSDSDQFAKSNDNVDGQDFNPGESATLRVTFSPTSEGLKTAQLNIPSNDPDTPTLVVQLQGRGAVSVCNEGSENVAFIPDPDGPGGGTLPTEDSEWSDFNFTNLPFGSVDAEALLPFDTIVLISCDSLNDLTGSQRTAIIDWVSDGGKLIIYDSECGGGGYINDFTWLPCGFESYGPGAFGADANSDPWVSLEIVEDNTLSDSDEESPYFIDTYLIAHDTDAAGDMNVFITQESCWCGDMLGTNAVDSQGREMAPGTTGYVHAYSHYGQGLMIYNGLDIDALYSDSDPTADTGEGYLAKIWLLELQQPWGDTCGLPCRARIQPLECDFEARPTRGMAPLEVDFTDLTTGSPDTWEWKWDFGDDKTSTKQNPTHIYTAAGRYTVTLEVTTSLGESCTETKVAYIIVQAARVQEAEKPPNLVPAFILVSPDQGYPGQEFEISINVGNDGGTTGTRSIALYINGVLEQSQTVSVSPGSAKLVAFQVTKYEPGTYQVNVEGNEGQFTVIKQASTRYFPGPLGTPGIIVIVVVAVVLIAAVVFVFVRR
jgi:PKD repeat protein